MLKQRILSALVLLPLPILALWYESPWFELLCAAVLTVMGWEWEKLVLKRFTVLGMLIAVTGVASVFMLGDSPEVAWTLPAVMTIALYVAAKKQNTEHQKLFAFGMAYSVYSYLSAYTADGTFSIYAGVGQDKLPEVIELIREELLLLKKKGITKEEFQGAREQLKSSYIFSLESVSGRMASIAR